VRWGWLTASLTAPETVRAGETLVYVVTLANSGDEPLRLDPCGGYRQTLADNSAGEPAPLKGAHLTLRLNCDDDPVIPAGGERAYVMELSVPPDAPELDALLLWQLVDTSPDQSGQTYVQITR